MNVNINNIIKRIVLVTCISFCSAVFISCEDKDTDSYVNNWILENMQFYYYWNEHIPASPNKGLYPDNFFYSLLYKYGKLDGDRFSWIQENYVDLLESLSGVNSGDLGFEYVFLVDDRSKVFGEVLYVKPGTNAEAQGIKRGNVFLRVDGTSITESNYSSILRKSSMKITFADAVLDGNTINAYNERDVVITKARYEENPVYLDTVYEINGKKIAYLIYNFFASDAGDNSKSYDKYLNSVFGNFKSAGVDNVIVDLRYNSGGSVGSATNLASLLASPLNTNDVFYRLEYNDNYPDTSVKFVSQIANISINNIGDNLQKLCFITSTWSASASEMVINGLKPIMGDKIIIVGDTTVGKSYASASFYEENNPRNRWGMQPLIAVFTNSDRELIPATGIAPNHRLRETFILPKKQLGDIHDDLLNIALSEISGMQVTHNTLQRKSMHGANLIDASVCRKAYSNQAIIESMKK
ncbi:MAG: hypothetical protein LBP63_05210 [Prevotellaceae bacterium]|jgi:C-terminal processing protease CtpA/Prc|nr:hypothetical protein [Prevotellaceae bacterium]